MRFSSGFVTVAFAIVPSIVNAASPSELPPLDIDIVPHLVRESSKLEILTEKYKNIQDTIAALQLRSLVPNFVYNRIRIESKTEEEDLPEKISRDCDQNDIEYYIQPPPIGGGDASCSNCEAMATEAVFNCNEECGNYAVEGGSYYNDSNWGTTVATMEDSKPAYDDVYHGQYSCDTNVPACTTTEDIYTIQSACLDEPYGYKCENEAVNTCQAEMTFDNYTDCPKMEEYYCKPCGLDLTAVVETIDKPRTNQKSSDLDIEALLRGAFEASAARNGSSVAQLESLIGSYNPGSAFKHLENELEELTSIFGVDSNKTKGDLTECYKSIAVEELDSPSDTDKYQEIKPTCKVDEEIVCDGEISTPNCFNDYSVVANSECNVVCGSMADYELNDQAIARAITPPKSFACSDPGCRDLACKQKVSDYLSQSESESDSSSSSSSAEYVEYVTAKKLKGSNNKKSYPVVRAKAVKSVSKLKNRRRRYSSSSSSSSDSSQSSSGSESLIIESSQIHSSALKKLLDEISNPALIERILSFNLAMQPLESIVSEKVQEAEAVKAEINETVEIIKRLLRINSSSQLNFNQIRKLCDRIGNVYYKWYRSVLKSRIRLRTQKLDLKSANTKIDKVSELFGNDVNSIVREFPKYL